jgi:nucleoside triphosphate diphosphatase
MLSATPPTDAQPATMRPSPHVERLVEIMAALRTPGTGCPWDLEQSFATIAPYTIEEAFEVADAIARDNMGDLAEELGDLLLQVVYHARLAEEAGAFAFPDVVQGITAKMIRRHPHVFGDDLARSTGAAKGIWDKIKAEEKAAKAARAPTSHASTVPSLLADVPVALPGLTRAVKLQEKAAKVGFDWPSIAPVFAKVREEIDELDAELRLATSSSTESGNAGTPIEEEFGDLLFVMANLARHVKIDPEAALRRANEKFLRRFSSIEAGLAARGSSPHEATLAEMDALWDAAKAAEKSVER